MNLTSKQIINALNDKQLTIPILARCISSYKGMNVKGDDLRDMLGGVKRADLEPYIRLILNLKSPKNFKPAKKKIDHRKEYKRRIDAMENAQDYIQNNSVAIARIIRHLGGMDVVAEVCGLKLGTIKGWNEKVNEHAIRGYVPDTNKPKLYEYAKKIRAKLSKEDWALITPTVKAPQKAKPKPFKTSQYRGVSKQCRKWVAAIAVNKRRVFLGRFETEKEAALAWNEAALKLGRPLNEVAV